MAGDMSRPSRYFLPLSSAIFKSRSNLHLRQDPQSPPPLPTINDVPDNTITALPAAPTSHVSPNRLRKKQASEDLTAAASPDATQPTTEKKKGKKGIWGRVVSKVKKMLWRRKKRGELVIGEPTGFEHVSTEGVGLRNWRGSLVVEERRPVTAAESEWETELE